MKTYEEAVEYAKIIATKKREALYIMTNGERFVVACGLDDKKYGEENGFKVVEF